MLGFKPAFVTREAAKRVLIIINPLGRGSRAFSLNRNDKVAKLFHCIEVYQPVGLLYAGHQYSLFDKIGKYIPKDEGAATFHITLGAVLRESLKEAIRRAIPEILNVAKLEVGENDEKRLYSRYLELYKEAIILEGSISNCSDNE